MAFAVILPHSSSGKVSVRNLDPSRMQLAGLKPEFICVLSL